MFSPEATYLHPWKRNNTTPFSTSLTYTVTVKRWAKGFKGFWRRGGRWRGGETKKLDRTPDAQLDLEHHHTSINTTSRPELCAGCNRSQQRRQRSHAITRRLTNTHTALGACGHDRGGMATESAGVRAFSQTRLNHHDVSFKGDSPDQISINFTPLPMGLKTITLQ